MVVCGTENKYVRRATMESADTTFYIAFELDGILNAKKDIDEFQFINKVKN